MQQEQPISLIERMRSTTNWGMVVVQSFSLPLEVMLHRNFGSRFFAMKGARACLFMVVWPVLFPRSSPLPMLLFLLLFLIALNKARLDAWRRERRGEISHSRYSGFPVLCIKHPTWSEITVKRYVEPGLAIVFGALTIPAFNQALGAFLIAGGMAMAMSVGAQLKLEKERRRDLQDALIDAAHMHSTVGRIVR